MKVYLSLQAKLRIVGEAYAQPNMLKATARRHNVQPTQIRRWRTTIPTAGVDNDGTTYSNKTLHTGRGTMVTQEHWAHLLHYFEELRAAGRVVSVRLLVIELCRLDPAYARLPPGVLDRRIRRFLERKRIVPRRVTRIAQNTRYNQVVIDDWVGYVNHSIVTSRYSPSCIVNVDETNIYFDMTQGVTLEVRGQRTINIRNTGSTQRCTVILAVAMDGRKLPPLIVFKGQPHGRIVREFVGAAAVQHGYPAEQVYTVQSKAWVDSRVFLLWINSVWSPFCEAAGDSSYLLLDEFSVHMKSECVRAIQDHGSEVEFIPGGYTGALMVLDKGVNKPFKQFVQQEYESWMVANEDGSKPSRAEVARWIFSSWERVTAETITNTWNSIGLQGWVPDDGVAGDGGEGAL